MQRFGERDASGSAALEFGQTGAFNLRLRVGLQHRQREFHEGIVAVRIRA